MRNLAFSIDEAALARAEAYAATKRTTIEELVTLYVQSVGDDIATIPLPQDAHGRFMRMLRHRGRDTTVLYVGQGGWDAFERPMSSYFYAWARLAPGLTIDGGANTGYYTLLAAHAAPENRVLAFEPDPAVHALLLQNITANGLGDRVVARSEALSSQRGTGHLLVPSPEHGVIETSSSLVAEWKPSVSQVVEVATVTVDEALAASAFARQPVSLIKLDVAGHEAAALAGAERTVGLHRPVLFAEVLDHADFGTLSTFIARYGYLDVPLRARSMLTAQAPITYESDAWNHAFVPAEKLHQFLSIAPGSP